MDLSLVIPCFHEAPRRHASVAAREVLDATHDDYEIVFVDDGGGDGARDLASTHGAAAFIHRPGDRSAIAVFEPDGVSQAAP